MKLKALIVAICLLPLTVLAQEKQDTRVWLSLFMPELRVEMQTGASSSLKTGVGLFFVGEYQSVNGETTKNTLESIVHINAEPRFFTTRKKRKTTNKTIDYFSGGYVGVPFHLYGSQGFSIGATYGTQGTLGQKHAFFYNFGIGLGYIDLELEKNPDLKGGDLIGTFGFGFRLK